VGDMMELRVENGELRMDGEKLRIENGELRMKKDLITCNYQLSIVNYQLLKGGIGYEL
jgi:hypothetical protein